MTRTPPGAFVFIEKRQRFVTPRGVSLRILPDGAENHEPVLVCETCRAPTMHHRHRRGRAVCRSCGTERRW